MRKSLTLFFSCPGGSVTPVQEFFRCAGMSYTVSESSEHPYDFEMVTRLNQRLHTTIYGFAEGALDTVLLVRFIAIVVCFFQRYHSFLRNGFTKALRQFRHSPIPLT